MDIQLPEWQSDFETKINKLNYDKLLKHAQNLVDRALLIYQQYCESQNDDLCNLFTVTLEELAPRIKLMVVVLGSNWFELKSLELQNVAEMVAWQGDMKATWLYNLAGCLRGY